MLPMMGDTSIQEEQYEDEKNDQYGHHPHHTNDHNNPMIYQQNDDPNEHNHQTTQQYTNDNTTDLPDGFSPVPSLAMVYKWMVSSIGESMGQAMSMSVRVSMPLDSIRSISHGISLRNPSQADEIWKNLWITAHTRHFHGVIVLGWARMQQNESCSPESCPKMIVGKTEVRWKQSPEELAAYEDGDPYKVTYLSLPAAEYIDRSLAENHGILSEPSITPFVSGQAQAGISDYEFTFSPYFIPTMKEVYKYILRVYTHLYLYHVDLLPSTWSEFLAPPQEGDQPTAQRELDRFSFHLSYFLNFGLSFHLITHEQVDSLGHAMKYFIWNLPDMEDQVPITFKQLVAQGGLPDHPNQQHVFQARPTSPYMHTSPYSKQTMGTPSSSSSNPFLQSSTSGSQFSSPTHQGHMADGQPWSPQLLPNGMMMMGTDRNGQPIMVYPQPQVNSQTEEAIKKLQEEVERLRLATTPQKTPSPPLSQASFLAPVPHPNGRITSPNANGANAPKAVSNIDPQLVALKRSELIKKAIAPFIAHNLAIAKVEQDLKESKFPPNYVPSPGYGRNGYILPQDTRTINVQSHTPSTTRAPNGGGIFASDDSPKILSPSSRERSKMRTPHEEEMLEERSISGGRTSKSRKDPVSVSSMSSSKRSASSKSSNDSSDDDSDSTTSPSRSSKSHTLTHSRPDATLLGTSPSSNPSDEPPTQPGDGTKKPIPRRQPMPNRQPPNTTGREPSCGQRLCF